MCATFIITAQGQKMFGSCNIALIRQGRQVRIFLYFQITIFYIIQLFLNIRERGHLMIPQHIGCKKNFIIYSLYPRNMIRLKKKQIVISHFLGISIIKYKMSENFPKTYEKTRLSSPSPQVSLNPVFLGLRSCKGKTTSY